MTHSKALFAVLTAGTLWSFGALTIRYMVDPQDYRWQYLFFRGLTVAGILCIYLMARDRHRFVQNFQKIGIPGIIGALGLVGVGWILFSLGARYFPAAELNLLSLFEVVGGVIWVYLPVFGINEVPSMLTVVGGCIVSGAILLNSLGARQEPVPAKPL